MAFHTAVHTAGCPDAGYCKESTVPHSPVHRHRRRLLAATICLLGIANAPVGATNLTDAVQAAWQRHPDAALTAAREQVASALQRKAEQPFADTPRGNIRYQTDALGAGPGYREWEAGVELPLWWPGQSSSYRNESERTTASAAALAQATLLQLAGEVRERLWRVALARNDFALAQSALKSARELAYDVERRQAAGELARGDLILAQKEVATREEALAQADTALADATQRFTLLTGLQDLPDVVTEALPASRPAPTHHPEQRLADADAERARAERDRVAAMRAGPASVWLGGKTSRAATGLGYDSAIGIELSVPLGGSAHAAPELSAAEERLTTAQVERDRTRRRLTEAVASADLEYQRAQQAVVRMARRLELAEEGLRLSRRAFELGELDLVRLIPAQADALNARHDMQAQRLEVGLRAARLNQATGVIPQ